jgi:hypothetical protein
MCVSNGDEGIDMKRLSKKEKTLFALRQARNYILEVADRDAQGKVVGWASGVLQDIDNALDANKPKVK